MKTPYDPVVRIGRREVELVRLSLRTQIVQVTALARDAELLAEKVRSECGLAAGDWTMSTHDWVRARREQARQIAQQQALAEAELTRLREIATEAYGRLHAAERATDAYVEKAKQEAARKTQAESDDLSSARRLLALRRRAGRRARQRDRHVVPR